MAMNKDLTRVQKLAFFCLALGKAMPQNSGDVWSHSTPAKIKVRWSVEYQCTVYSVQHTVYSVQCTVYSIQCTVYSVQCTVYSVKCTFYSVQCTVYG